MDPTDVVNTVANTVVSAAKAVGSAIVGSASSEPRYGTTTSVNVDAVLEGVPYAGDDDPETAQSIRWDLQAKFARQAETDALARANTYDQHRPTAEAGNFPPTLYYVAGKSGSRIAPIYARDENGNYPNALRPGESALPLLKDWEYENVNGTIQAHKDPTLRPAEMRSHSVNWHSWWRRSLPRSEKSLLWVEEVRPRAGRVLTRTSRVGRYETCLPKGYELLTKVFLPPKLTRCVSALTYRIRT